jgi:hypothetical protein
MAMNSSNKILLLFLWFSGETTLFLQAQNFPTNEKLINNTDSTLPARTNISLTNAFNLKFFQNGSGSQAQLISGKELNIVRLTNINNALAGKVAGMQVRSQSDAALGRTGNIRLHGDGGFSTGSNPIYVVDGAVLSDPNDINLDDIEDFTVLSGPSSSALFGPQGANGAIVISLKKAQANAGIGVELNLGVQIQRVYILPQFQNSYAGGYSDVFNKYTWQPGQPEEWKSLDGKYYPNYSEDVSWGPRMAGQEYIPWYAWYPGTKYTVKTAALVPQPNNIRDFYQLGMISNNSVSISKSSENLDFRLSYANVNTKGTIPTTGFGKNILSLKTGYKIFKTLSIGANLNYVTTNLTGEINDSYNNQTSGLFNQWFHRDLDMNILNQLTNLRTPAGNYASWNLHSPDLYDPLYPSSFYGSLYWQNPYTWLNQFKITQQNDRFYGDLFFDFEILKDFSFRGTYRRQQFNSSNEEKFNSDIIQTDWQANWWIYGGGYYSTGVTNEKKENFEGLLSYKKNFMQVFNINLDLGSDFSEMNYKNIGGHTNGGLKVQNIFSLDNSNNVPSINEEQQRFRYRALFGRISMNYKEYLFVDGTYRNDWLSTLPQINNKITSKSLGLSFVFSELLKIPFLDFGKIRAAWGEIPEPINYQTYPGTNYTVNYNLWNSKLLMTSPNLYIDPNIIGSVKSQMEFGIDIHAIHNRLGLSANYWTAQEREIPYSITSNEYNGYNSLLISSGQINKKGIDLILYVQPIKLQNLQWDVNVIYSRLLDNRIVKIAPGIDRFFVQGMWTFYDGKSTTSRNGAPIMVHELGHQWGELVGGGMKRLNGQPILDESGNYISNPDTYFGNVLPKYTGGIQNSIRFLKSFVLNLNIDYQFGGKFFSLSEMWGSYSGQTARTAALNDKGIPIRDPLVNGGGVHVSGVNSSGDPLSYYIDAQTYFTNLYNSEIYDDYVYDLTFIKLRELSLGYTIPVNRLGAGKLIREATLSLVAQNLWLIYAKTKDFDPSEISQVSGESGQYPGFRSFGANLKVCF